MPFFYLRLKALYLPLSKIAKSSLDSVAGSKVESLENLCSRISSFECRYARRSMKRILERLWLRFPYSQRLRPKEKLGRLKNSQKPTRPKKHLTRPPTKYECVQRKYDGNLMCSFLLLQTDRKRELRRLASFRSAKVPELETRKT